jgi:hemerythrin superfamily protein
MNAIEMLKAQHRQAEQLFEQIDESPREAKWRLFLDLADLLAVHAVIEERHFYSAVRARRTQEIVTEALEEHLAIKRTLADLLRTDVGDQAFTTKIGVLEEQVTQHVGEEESNLFPQVLKIMDEDQLEALAREMAVTIAELGTEESHGHPSEEAARPPFLH